MVGEPIYEIVISWPKKDESTKHPMKVKKHWDKYHEPITQLRKERDAEVKKLDEILKRLGYYG